MFACLLGFSPKGLPIVPLVLGHCAFKGVELDSEEQPQGTNDTNVSSMVQNSSS